MELINKLRNVAPKGKDAIYKAFSESARLAAIEARRAKAKGKQEPTKMATNSLVAIWRLSTNKETPGKDLMGQKFKTPNGKIWEFESMGVSESFDAFSGRKVSEAKERFLLKQVK